MIIRIAIALALAGMLTVASSAQTGQSVPAAAVTTPEQFVSTDGFRGAALSPDGRYLAGVREGGVVDELVVIDLTSKQVQVVQRANEETAGVQIAWVDWKTSDLLIVGTLNRVVVNTRTSSIGSNVERTKDSDEYWIDRVVAIPRTGGAAVGLFNGQNRRLALTIAPTHFVSRLPSDADHILLSAYGQSGLTLWRANVRSGAVSKIEDAGWDTINFHVDVSGVAVLRVEELPRQSGYRWFRRAPGARSWTQFHEVKKAAASHGGGFEVFSPAALPGKIYVAARREGDDRAAIYMFDAATGEYGAPLATHAVSDMTAAMIDDTSHTLLAGCALVHRYECQALDPMIGRHLRAIEQFFGAGAVVGVVQMSADQKVWLLSVEAPTALPAYFIYFRDERRIEAVASTRSALAELKISETVVSSYVARDGTPLWGYLTNAPAAGAPAKALIVMPHGGPEARDEPGFDDWTQFLASRGYVVFRPNFRGGEGFGRAFAAAGYRQWGKRMQDDVTDGVKHLIATGVADPARICIFGWSYGGYAALAGGALTPDLYKCVIAGAGPSDLAEMLEFERRESGRGSATYDYWRTVIGDLSTDRDALAQVSPRRLAANFRAPVLLLHGKEDGVVSVEESRRMHSALRAAGKSVRYVEFEEEGHGLMYRENELTFYREIDAFLKQHLPPN